MKQVFQNPKTGKTTIEEITPPTLKPGGILVQNTFSLVSAGTERTILTLAKKGLLAKARERPEYVRKFAMLAKTKGIKAAWQVAKSKLTTDIALGYSAAGTVLEAADDVKEFNAGDRVAIAGQDYASHAEICFVPKNLVVKIPKRVKDNAAAFTTIGAIAMQGIRRASLSQGERVAVIGLGLLGQLAVRILRAYGHPVIGFDIDRKKVALAVKNGAEGVMVTNKGIDEKAVDVFTDGRGVDAALIYASSKDDAPVKLAVSITREKGRIVQIGNVLANIPWRDFYKKELTYHSSNSYGPGRYDPTYEEEGNDYPFGYVRWTEQRNMEEFLRLLDEERITVDDITTGVFPIEDAEKAYERIMNPGAAPIFGMLLKYEAANIPATIALHATDPAVSQDTRVTIGLIGVGSFATSTILPHLKEYMKKNKDGSVRLHAICSAHGKKAKDIGDAWGAEYVTNDYKKILEDLRINLVIVATRHSSHAKIAEDVLKAHKNLYIEKPLALREEDIERIVKRASNAKGMLFVGFNRRFSTHFKEAKRIFKNREEPRMILYRVNYPFEEKDHWSYAREEGGRIIGEDCHFVDALSFLAGAKPVKVHASAVPVGGGIAQEENVIITIEHENGSIGTIFYSALGNFKMPKEYIEIHGGGNIMTIDNFKSAKLITPEKNHNFSLRHQNKGYTEELAAVIDAIKEGKRSPISLEDIYYSHLATFAAVESLKTGEVIEL